MRKTKIFSSLIAITLVSSLVAGCGKGGSSSEDSSKTTDKMDKSPISITFYNADGTAKTSTFTDPIAKEITKRTGVTLKIETPVGGNNSRVPLMIASKEYPDMIYGKADTSKLVEAGALVTLDKYIDKYPNMKKLYGTYLSRLKYSVDDPKIYTVGAYGVAPPGTELWSPGGMFCLQNAVLKDLGYPQIKSLKDYETAIKTYKEKYPTINGQKTIGLSLLADDWRWLISIGNPAGAALGYPDDGQWAVDPNTNVAQYKFLLPEMKDYFKWLNNMNNEGLLDPESFTQKTDQYTAKLTTGRVLAIADANWSYSSAEVNLIKANTPERTYLALPAVLDPSKEKNASMRDVGWGGGSGIGITTSCKNPERVYQFLDWMASDEAQILANWGIEGVNYKIVDGKRVIPDDEQKKKNTDPDYGMNTGIGSYIYIHSLKEEMDLKIHQVNSIQLIL